jgi:LPS export ABC transporter protein LptC
MSVMNRVAAVGALMLTLVTLGGCQEMKLGPGSDLPELQADRVMIDMEHFASQNAIRRARLHADTALVFEDSAAIQLRGMQVSVFDAAGASSGTVTANGGSINTRTDAMIARGNVVLTTVNEGRTITTEELHYDPQSGRMWSDVQTRIRNADGTEQVAESMNATIVDGRFTSFNARNASGTTRGIAF